jgi:hypothetical protein
VISHELLDAKKDKNTDLLFSHKLDSVLRSASWYLVDTSVSFFIRGAVLDCRKLE